MKRHIDCKQRWLGFLLVFSLIAIQWVIPTDSPCQSSNLTIGNYVKVGEKRISRTVYEYTYRASVTNTGPGVLNAVATVASNSTCTTIMDNTLTFGNVPAGATVNSSDTFTIRQDRLYPFSWSNLTWNISFQATQSTRTVGQEGGTLEFHNGLVLEVPPGAVSGSTPIVIKDLPLEQVTAIVMNPALSSNRTKRFLGGFTAEPDGLAFNGPVTATIPVLPLNPYETPAQIEIFLNEQRYRYVTSQFEYWGDQGVVKVNIQHFSGQGFVALSSQELNDLCTTCGFSHTLPNYDVCRNFDPIQYDQNHNACCLIRPEWRTQSDCQDLPSTGCYCCREKRIKVEEIGIDFATTQCQLANSDLKVTFLDCPGSPTESTSVGETSCNDLKLEITIEPDNWTLAVGESKDFRAYVTGTWKTGPQQGVIAFSHASIDPIWRSGDGTIADFLVLDNGMVTNTLVGKKSNLDPIEIYAKVNENPPYLVEPGRASVKVTGDYIDIRITPPGDEFCPGESKIFEAYLMNSADEQLFPFPIPVMWESSNSSVASCGPCYEDPAVLITAANIGGPATATITARSVDYDLTQTAQVTVEREIPKINISSYHSGDKAYAAGANLVGTIVECGTRRVKWIQVTAESKTGSNISLLTPVGDDAKFSVLINLDWGINHLTFITRDANNGLVPNNMAGKDFWLRRVPHCVKIGGTNPPKLPTVLYGTPVTWYSEKPEIATVDATTDPQYVAVTGHAKGWAKLYTYWQGYTVVRWVGVSKGTNYVPTHQDDPFYEPEHVPSPAVVQMLAQMGYFTYASDLNNKYFVGQYLSDPNHACLFCGFQQYLGFLYDGSSIQSISPSTGCILYVIPLAVNEKGQVVGDIGWISAIGCVKDWMGFIYNHGILSYVADPYAYGSYLMDINNLGKAAGNSYSGAGYDWGFIYDMVFGTFTYIASMPVYINDSGQVLGETYSANGISLWLYKDGVYEPVVGPRYIDGYSLHESGQVYVHYENGQSDLLTRCAPGN